MVKSFKALSFPSPNSAFQKKIRDRSTTFSLQSSQLQKILKKSNSATKIPTVCQNENIPKIPLARLPRENLSPSHGGRRGGKSRAPQNHPGGRPAAAKSRPRRRQARPRKRRRVLGACSRKEPDSPREIRLFQRHDDWNVDKRPARNRQGRPRRARSPEALMRGSRKRSKDGAEPRGGPHERRARRGEETEP
jgi:hypothetical protein